jgi:hypothetical protein
METICVFALVAFALVTAAWLAARKKKLRLFDKDADGSSSFTVLQEFVEPNVKHVKQVNVQKQKSGQNGPNNDTVE